MSLTRVTVLAGGVGGARFLSGLIRRTDTRRLTVIGNTGDDEEFFGLHVAPDLDTVVYTLAGVAPRRRGWGLAGDAFTCLAALGGLGFPTWFRLGDRDLATHLARTAWLRAGWSLSRVTAALARAHGVRARGAARSIACCMASGSRPRLPASPASTAGSSASWCSTTSIGPGRRGSRRSGCAPW